ncbi:unnamed protein product [Prorocentrum cordatum]|uniref:DNA (cytosine-5-)-methyltransferase n=1 Tax=Prorocentrum cordatum TaxID=2364126 RepID=A0ABN9T1K9_9DINO|nr:unnamed protein product [Polarella glacialis]
MAEAGPDDADGLLGELGSQELEGADEGEGPAAAAAQPGPIVIEAREIYQGTGFDCAGAEQCSFVWQALRSRVAGAIREGAPLRICTEEPCNVGALPRNCREVVRVRDALRLDLAMVADVYAQCLGHNPGATWPADLPGRSRLGLARRCGRCSTPRQAARARPGGEVLDERVAKVARLQDAGPPRGSREPATAPLADGGEAAGGARELAAALMAAMKGSAAQAAAGGDTAAASDPLGAGDGGGLPRGLATKRAYCRKLAQESPGWLSELTLGHMAEFLGALEGGASVGPTSALALRCLLTVYLPQNPVRQIGAPMFRELRALAEAIDVLLQGKVQHALDVLTQRVKAAQVAISDGHWDAAKWLELIHARDEPPEGKAAPRGLEQRVVRLDGAPLAFKTAKASHAKKEGESAKACRTRLLELIKDSKPPPARKYGPLGLAPQQERKRNGASRHGTTRFLRERVAAFVGDPFDQVSVPAADEALSGATVAYAGEPVAKALPRVLAELAPGLRKAEHAARLGALDDVGPEVAEWLACPEKALLPEAQWPNPMPRVNVESEADWRDLAVHLVSLGIFTVLPEDELVRVRAEPLLNGLFAVEKRGQPGPGAMRVTRLILNMAPGNALLKPRVGEAEVLAASTTWVSLHIPEEKLMLWLCRLPPPAGAGLPIELEWRKDDSLPVVQACSSQDAGWWQVFIDDFDAPEIVEEKRARQLLGTESDLQRRARDSYRRAGVAYSSEKAHLRQLRVERMGADVDGESCRLAGPRDKLLATAALCLATLAEDLVPWRLCMTVLGKMVRTFEFRRPLFCQLNAIWALSTSRTSVRYNAEMVEELILSIMLLPTAATSMRSRIDGMATVSDASEFGGGVCVSTGLRRGAELALNACGDITEHLGVGARFPNMPADPQRPWISSSPRIPKGIVLKVLNVLVIGLFDGIGGLAVAFSRLPVRIVAYVAAETDAKARRVVRLRWPGAVDGDLIQDLCDTFNDSVDICVAGAGAPCQDLSRLDLSGGGLHGRKSSLFFEVPRIFKLLRLLLGAKLHALLENVASMAEDNVRAISECMGVAPYLICSSVLVPCRRPRLFWLSWALQIVPPHRLVDGGFCLEVVGDAGSALDVEWEGPGCCWRGRPRPFPTLVCCRPLPSFPAAPRGLALASSEAEARWRCTAVATKGSSSSGANDARCFLLGNSFCVYVVAWASQRILLAEGALSRPLALAELARAGECRETWGQRGAFEGDAGLPDADEARRPVLYLSRAEKGGSDIRLDCGLPYRPRGRPRSSLGPFARRWRAVVSMAWPRGRQAHINVRELQAALAALRWRSRKASARGSRWLHLVDSRVVAAIVTKGRRPQQQPPKGAAAALKRRSLRGQTLASPRVVAATRVRYARAVQYGVSPQEVSALGVDGEDADGLVANYLAAKWREGAGIALANNPVAGDCFTVPRLRRRLDLSWALLKAWRRAEPAARVLPFTPEIVGAMAGLAADAAAFDVGCLLLISFEGLLRGGEAFASTTADVLDRGEVIVLRVSTSKTTAGKDAAEARGWASSMTARIYAEGAVADLVRVRPGDPAAAAVRHGVFGEAQLQGPGVELRSGVDPWSG